MGTRVLFRMVKLSEERQLRITALFRAFDYDSSGSIEPQEFLCIGKALKNGEWTEEMNAAAHARVDTDKGGSIDGLEFCNFFENNLPKNRTDEQFFKLMDRYMVAAIAGRAEFYFNQGAELRSTTMSADAPESFKIKAEALARACSHEQSAKYIAKQERHLKRRGMYARAAKPRLLATTSVSQRPSSCSSSASAVCATCTLRPRRSCNFSVSAKSTLECSFVSTRPPRRC